MKSWIKRTLYGLVGATVLMGGLAACGHRYDGPGRHMSAQDQGRFRERIIERVAGRLDLNDDQKRRLGVVADKLREQRLAVMGEAADPRAQVQALVTGEKFDRAGAQALVAEKTAAVSGKSPEVIAALGDFYDSLNASQQAKVREFMQQHRHRHGSGWWRRG